MGPNGPASCCPISATRCAGLTRSLQRGKSSRLAGCGRRAHPWRQSQRPRRRRRDSARHAREGQRQRRRPQRPERRHRARTAQSGIRMTRMRTRTSQRERARNDLLSSSALGLIRGRCHSRSRMWCIAPAETHGTAENGLSCRPLHDSACTPAPVAFCRDISGERFRKRERLSGAACPPLLPASTSFAKPATGRREALASVFVGTAIRSPWF